MVVVMAADASASDVDHVVAVVQEAGGDAFVSRGESRTIIGLSGDIERFAATLNLASLPGVADVVRISVPYKLVSREHRRERSVIRVAGVPIGPDEAGDDLRRRRGVQAPGREVDRDPQQRVERESPTAPASQAIAADAANRTGRRLT